MTIELKEDVMYILLKKISDRPKKDGPTPLNLSATDFVGRNTDHTEILSHLDYLNQKGYINADFDGDAYADKGPNPLPDNVDIENVELTPKGEALFKDMSENPPKALESGPSTEIATKDTDFLKKVMLKGHIEDIYDARDATEVVFRTMRDLMSPEATKKVSSELHTEALHTDKKAVQEEVAELWKESNPLVRLLIKIRPTLKFDDETFFFRVEQEGGLAKTTGPKTVVKAVFGATKEELSAERVAEIAEFMPGEVRKLWEEA